MNEYIFLIEIGTEELPPKILKKIGKDFANQIIIELKKNKICYDNTNWFASPCHLAFKANIIIPTQLHTKGNNTFPETSNKKNYSNHSATQLHNNTGIKKIHSLLHKEKDNNNKIKKQKTVIPPNQLTYTQNYNPIINQETKDVFIKLINNALSKLTNYETMRWGNIQDPFIRPIRTITVLLNQHLIEYSLFGVNINRILYGNRCMKKNQIILNHADDYPTILMKNGWVIADYYLRKKIILAKSEKIAKKLGGIIILKDKNLLEENTSLVEWPVILFGQFDKKFLTLPSEIILHIMQKEQKYFPVYNPINNTLLPYFIFVANTINKNHKRITIGHEKVIITKLIDAEFFLKNDQQYRLEDYIPKLNSVMFHNKLGSLQDKIHRIEKLSGWIAKQINADIIQTKRAGYLCKCDLMSQVVSEFPSTQGIMGMHYALRDGESEQVAIAQKEHYQPKFSNDLLPINHIACAVSIADKIDTISGIFGIQEIPKGNRDPFAIKRSAIGILRILIEKKIPLNLLFLIKKSIQLYESKLTNETNIIYDIHRFMYNRLRSWYITKGYKKNIIQSILNIKLTTITEFEYRINAVSNFCKLQKENNIALYLVYKRISSLLLQNQKKSTFLLLLPNEEYNAEVQTSLLIAPEEIYLYLETSSIEDDINLLLNQKNYYEALISITTLTQKINQFFDNVVIMHENQNIRINRINLLKKIKNLFLKLADFSLLNN